MGETVTLDGYKYHYGDRPLEGFTIQRAAGRGGFGEVYFAISDSGREVALKAIHGNDRIELRGIGQCMNLKSPHLVSIFDVKHNEEGKPFVIMEYVAGPSLRQLIDESPSGLGVQKSAFLLREIAKGLTYLHDRGIVHRDLKPANIFYEGGYVKIGDYGLSKAIGASHHSGQTITVGTLHYMAPEIGQGQYGRSVDIYSLGIVLYEMLGGQPPFVGSSPGEILMKHMSDAPDLSNIDESFAGVIRKALAKTPEERYATAQEMVEDVFGVDHIRESVSHFAPQSLTLVAGRAARNIDSPEDSEATVRDEGNGGRDRWDRVGNRVAHAGRRIEGVGRRMNARELGESPSSNFPHISPKRRLWAMVLTFGWFVWIAGLQRFYVGKFWTGLLWLCTGGIIGVGQLYDVIMIAMGRFTDRRGRPLVVWHSISELEDEPDVPSGWSPSKDVPAIPGREQEAPKDRPDPTVASRRNVRRERDPSSWFLSLLGTLSIVIAMLIGIGVAVNLPTALTVGAPHDFSEEMHDIFGYNGWPSLVLLLGTLATLLSMLSGAILLILARRRHGLVHMARAVCGSLLLLFSLGIFQDAFDRGWRGVANAEVYSIGETTEVILRNLNLESVGFSVAFLLAAVVVLAMPSRKRRLRSAQEAKS
jgi:serine/threonine protein kinase